MFLVNEDFLDRLLMNSMKMNRNRNRILLSMEDTKLNIELRKALLQTLNLKIKKPIIDLDYSLSLSDILNLIDLYVDEYICESQDIIEKYLNDYYWTGVTNALNDLSTAIEEKGVKYTPMVMEKPENLHFLLDMLQRNIEDYGLVLRGRLRSRVEVKYWRKAAYGI